MEYLLIGFFYAVAVRGLSEFGNKRPLPALAMCSIAMFTLVGVLVAPSLG